MCLALSWKAVGLTEGGIPLSAYADIPLFKGDFSKTITVGANIVRPSIFSYSGKRYPRSHFRNPSGGIARFSRCPPWACKRFCLPFLVCAVLIFRVFVLGMVFALIQRLLRLFLFCFPVRN